MSTRNFRIYREEAGTGRFLGKIHIFLADRPGSLAELASIFSQYAINIVFFHYNRTEHPNRVLLEVESDSADALNLVRKELTRLALFTPDSADRFELGVIDTRNILKIEVQLEHRPGTLGRFALLLAKHNANVIHMYYHEEVSETSAHVSIVTNDPQEIDQILKEMNDKGYYYSTVYRGAGHRHIEDVIGLNLAERFFFSLQKILHTDDIAQLKKLVASSKLLTDSLVNFSREAGKYFGEGNIITSVLAFASASLSKTGVHFSCRRLPPINRGGVTCHIFRLPSGGNLSLLEGEEGLLMIDSGYGLYYNDVKQLFHENGFAPSQIKGIYLTHADADHAGLSGYFSREFGIPVHLHSAAKGIIEHENRAWGSDTPLLTLNHYFTVLVNEFTRSGFPDTWTAFGNTVTRPGSIFRAIDSFHFSGHTYYVIESLGGHVPGQVFFFSDDSGLIFTADYLLLVESLSPEERELLSYPKFFMQSTNVNSQVFRREMEMLSEFILSFSERIAPQGHEVIVVPGHGDYYPAGKLL
jgi:glyoxylase-like metal-dependent hydrolase (beta-lactamase superfamily II)